MLFGFVLSTVGIYAGWTSTRVSQTYSLDSPNSVPNDAVLSQVVGVLVAIFGGVLLLV